MLSELQLGEFIYEQPAIGDSRVSLNDWCTHPGEALDSALEEEVHALEMGWHLGWLLRREGLIPAAPENPLGTGQQNARTLLPRHSRVQLLRVPELFPGSPRWRLQAGSM